MNTAPLSIIILAAGKGQRMRSAQPKVMHEVGGVPMLARVVQTAQQLEPAAIYVVHGNGSAQVRQCMKHLPVTWVEQAQRLGTGHAVLQVMDRIPLDHMVLVLYGDVPLVEVNTLMQLQHKTPKQGVGVVVTRVTSPTGFGRIVRNEMGHITAIVEHKDASEAQRQIDEINTGILMAQASLLSQWLPRLSQQNAQSEYYLTDVIGMAVADGRSVGGVMASCHEEVLGVNNREQLAQIERFYQRREARRLMLEGVTLMDPQRVDLRGSLVTAGDVTLDVNVVIAGDNRWGANIAVGPGCVLSSVKIGHGVTIGAHCVIRDAVLGDGVVVADHTVIESATLEARACVGPFARLRPGTHMAEASRVGNFVELKNTHLGSGSKASHLSYLGDARVGSDVNVGAGVITCNFDGAHKHHTVIESDAMVGAHCSLVAPVTVGAEATVGAGTVLVEDAPAGQLTLARSKQQTVAGWKRPVKATATVPQD